MTLTTIISWDLSSSLLVFVATLLIIKLAQALFDSIMHQKSVPGPWGFPVVGHLPLLGANPAKTLMTYSIRYGDVFKIRMGSWTTIVLNSNEAIREALMDYSEVFSDRPEFLTGKLLRNMKSIAFGSYTKRWKLHKKIARKVLRQYASLLDHGYVEQVINVEIDKLNDGFKKTTNRATDPHDEIFLTVGCIVYQICFGITENCRENGMLKKLLDSTVFIETTSAGNPLDVLPWLQFVMPWKVKEMRDGIQLTTDIAKVEIKRHEESFDRNNPRDITDGLIIASEKYGNSPDVYHGITKDDIVTSVENFMAAGFDTTSSTLEWIILYLSCYEKVQDKLKQEISEVLGNKRLTPEDRAKLPYTQAVIQEVIRLSGVVPMSVPHATTSDVKFRGFDIKKGSVVLCNTYACARDERIWENPTEFIPERFLNGNNELVQDKMDQVLMFGVGLRRCPGEFLAKMELFLIVCNLFQRFNFELVSNPDFEAIFALVCRPKPYKIRVTERL